MSELSPPASEEEISQENPSSLQKHIWTQEEVDAIVQPRRWIAALFVYLIFIYCTGNFLLNIFLVLKTLQTRAKVISSDEQQLQSQEALGWTAVATSGFTWLLALGNFIWFHIVCQSQIKDKKIADCYRSTLTSCLPTLTV